VGLPDRLAAAIKNARPEWRNETGIVAVSGGADSVALLRLLSPSPLEGEGRPRFGDGVRGIKVDGRNPSPGPRSAVHPLPQGERVISPKLIAVHVNHMLRGAESDADEAFVIELAKRLEIEVRTIRLPLTPGNVENEARKARYEFFRCVAEETGAAWIATAHTLDDQAETVLHRLIRGTGIQGLRGILSTPGGAAPGLSIVRPLLDIRRIELREYLASIQQSHREDSSNFDPRFTRNRIRHELLPMLETFNPRIAEVLNSLSHQASELRDFAEGETALLLKAVELERAGKMLIFDAEKLESLTEPQRRAVLRMAWQREGWPLLGMTFVHWVRLAELDTNNFPDGIRSRRVGNVLQLANS